MVPLQGCSQPYSLGWARVPLSSFSSQISINFSYFSTNVTYFLPHLSPLGGRVAHPGRPWLRHCSLTLTACYLILDISCSICAAFWTRNTSFHCQRRGQDKGGKKKGEGIGQSTWGSLTLIACNLILDISCSACAAFWASNMASSSAICAFSPNNSAVSSDLIWTKTKEVTFIVTLGRRTNYRTVPVTGRFNVSGVLILFLQLYRRFNSNKLQTQNVMQLNGCFVAIYVKQSSQNPMITVLRMSCYYQKRDTYEVA